ncbi:hypothetical protein [Knoellia koreensis]|uniref:hypothetical protein n=1 Tax=Knoellia koreensis TaxID=2730921 RepID=UPI00197E22A1|nr:hypothetical protein [Knoellia sp. DB2414S]
MHRAVVPAAATLAPPLGQLVAPGVGDGRDEPLHGGGVDDGHEHRLALQMLVVEAVDGTLAEEDVRDHAR